ncbi:MAG: hypothetical protein C7B44_15170 [Sulfobacillus thermosulfidooxidans]|nr:MAG: hypothetical protein C7B44_15170 [Sulfobacillus thermosulfidooxidans]
MVGVAIVTARHMLIKGTDYGRTERQVETGAQSVFTNMTLRVRVPAIVQSVMERAAFLIK